MPVTVGIISSHPQAGHDIRHSFGIGNFIVMQEIAVKLVDSQIEGRRVPRRNWNGNLRWQPALSKLSLPERFHGIQRIEIDCNSRTDVKRAIHMDGSVVNIIIRDQRNTPAGGESTEWLEFKSFEIRRQNR